MHYDPSDLGSLTMIQITPKERNLGHLMATADEIFSPFFMYTYSWLVPSRLDATS